MAIGNVVGITSASLMIALALVLASLDFQKRANRAFALLLFYRGMTSLLGFSNGLLSPETQHFVVTFLPYVLIPVVPAALYFALVHPAPKSWLARNPVGPWVLMGATGAVMFAYLFNHGLYGDVQYTTGLTDFRRLSAAVEIGTVGPLWLILSLQAPALAALSIRFARDFANHKSDTQRFSSYLVAVGFMLNGFFDGARAAYATTYPVGGDFPWAPWGWSMVWLPVLALPLSAIALIIILRANQTKQARTRNTMRLTILAALAAGSAIAPQVLGSDGFLSSPVAVALLSVWRLALPVLVSYALLRYALFDLDARVRRVLSNGSVAAVFGAVYFAASETIEALLSSLSGQWVGLAAAALLTVAIGPIKKFGTRVGARIMPSAVPAAEASGDKLEMYRQQCEMILEDGHLSPKERKLLDVLRETWGISSKDAARIELSISMASTMGAPGKQRVVAG